MRRLAIVGLLAITLSGCIEPNSNNLHDGELTSRDFSIVCLDGVQYYVYRTGRFKGKMAMAPRFKQDGTLHTCEPIREFDVR